MARFLFGADARLNFRSGIGSGNGSVEDVKPGAKDSTIFLLRGLVLKGRCLGG